MKGVFNAPKNASFGYHKQSYDFLVDILKLFLQQHIHIDVGDVHSENIFPNGAFRHLIHIGVSTLWILICSFQPFR